MPVSSDHLLSGMAEHPLCRRIPMGEVALIVQRDDHLLCGIDDPPQVLLLSLLTLFFHVYIYSQFRRGSATEKVWDRTGEAASSERERV